MNVNVNYILLVIKFDNNNKCEMLMYYTNALENVLYKLKQIMGHNYSSDCVYLQYSAFYLILVHNVCI